MMGHLNDGPEDGVLPLSVLSYVTVDVAGQPFGISIERALDVFVVEGVTPVPLAPTEVLGLVSLRGRVVTVVDLAYRLGSPSLAGRRLAVGVEAEGHSYGLLVDGVGDVIGLDPTSLEGCPSHGACGWAGMSTGMHRLGDRILVVLDIDAVLDLPSSRRVAA
jgi:purine-binding chemotaxis protein CheW